MDGLARGPSSSAVKNLRFWARYGTIARYWSGSYGTDARGRSHGLVARRGVSMYGTRGWNFNSYKRRCTRERIGHTFPSFLCLWRFSSTHCRGFGYFGVWHLSHGFCGH